MMQSDPNRRARGDQKTNEILSQRAEPVEHTLGDMAPDLATCVIETIYGELVVETPAPAEDT
jgi:4-carboxymuconolactone decarboxylase